MKIVFTLATASLTFFVGSLQAAYPEKPVRLIVPFAAGGPTDVVARTLADAASQALGQSFIVDNRPGAAGALGTAMVARSQADGYTLGVGSVSTLVVNPSCNPNLDYDPAKSFDHLALVADMPLIWIEHAPGKGFKDNLDAIKKSPEKYTLGTPGSCSLGHLLLEQINDSMGVALTHIPYKGSAPSMNDFLAKSVDYIFDAESVVMPHVRSGRAMPMAVNWPRRLPALPDTPTLAELGYPEVKVTPWYGVIAPAGLPDDVKKVLVEALGKAMQDPKLQDRFKNVGMVPISTAGPDTFAKRALGEFNSTKAFIERRNISSSN